jgi:hypothetical protein
VRTPYGFRGGTQLRRDDGGAPDVTFRHGTDGPERWPVDPGYGDRSRSVHRRLPRSISGGSECARLPLHTSQRDRFGRAIGIRWDGRRQQRPSTSRRCDSRPAALPADGGRLGSVGSVRNHNGHGSSFAPSPSLPCSPLGTNPSNPDLGCMRCRDARNGMTTCERIRFWAKSEVGIRGCQGG